MNGEEKPVEGGRKQKAKRRPWEEIAADYERRALRIKWGGPRDALEMLTKAQKLIEEAHSACGAIVIGPVLESLKKACMALAGASDALRSEIPPEAR